MRVIEPFISPESKRQVSINMDIIEQKLASNGYYGALYKRLNDESESLKNWNACEAREYERLIESDKRRIELEAALEKENPQKAVKGDYDHNGELYPLMCPNCYDEPVGALVDEDGDGSYKYNIYSRYCRECGQKIEEDYTEEDYKNWGLIKNTRED